MVAVATPPQTKMSLQQNLLTTRLLGCAMHNKNSLYKDKFQGIQFFTFVTDTETEHGKEHCKTGTPGRTGSAL